MEAQGSVKDNWWIEIKCPTVKGKKYRTIAFRGTEEQAKNACPKREEQAARQRARQRFYKNF